MGDLSGPDHVFDLFDRNGFRLDAFRCFQMRCGTLFRAVDLNRIAEISLQSRIRMDLADDMRVFSGISGFLHQFADSRRDRGGVRPGDASAGNFPFRPARAVAELADQDQFIRPGPGDHVDPVAGFAGDEFVSDACPQTLEIYRT